MEEGSTRVGVPEIKEVFDCGNIYRLNYERYEKWRPHVKYKVSNFQDIYGKIIPFFKQYPLQAKKLASFEAFCLAAELIKSKEHLSSDGIAKIQALRHRDSLDALEAHVQWGATVIT